MSDALRRAIRTAVQGFVGSFASSGVLSAANTSGVVDWSLTHKALVSAGSAALIALVSLVQNWAEDSPKVAFPAVLKAEASPGVNPVTVDPIDVPAPVAKKPAKKKAAKPVAKVRKK